jgi:hypothetical protein
MGICLHAHQTAPLAGRRRWASGKPLLACFFGRRADQRFMTDRWTRKVGEIARRGRMTLVYYHQAGGAYVMPVGRTFQGSPGRWTSEEQTSTLDRLDGSSH